MPKEIVEIVGNKGTNLRGKGFDAPSLVLNTRNDIISEMVPEKDGDVAFGEKTVVISIDEEPWVEPTVPYFKVVSHDIGASYGCTVKFDGNPSGISMINVDWGDGNIETFHCPNGVAVHISRYYGSEDTRTMKFYSSAFEYLVDFEGQSFKIEEYDMNTHNPQGYPSLERFVVSADGFYDGERVEIMSTFSHEIYQSLKIIDISNNMIPQPLLDDILVSLDGTHFYHGELDMSSVQEVGNGVPLEIGIIEWLTNERSWDVYFNS